MSLSDSNLLQLAYKGGYAVPAFSVHTFDMIDAILHEAQSQSWPVLLQIGQRAIRNGQMNALTDYIRAVAPTYEIPIAIHLDHCRQSDQVIQAIRAGMTSIMMDASSLSFEQNIEETREIVRICHAIGLPVEGELGAIGGVEDDISVDEEDVVYTSVEAAVEFAEKTGVDSLAVAIGSAHGMYKREPKLDLARLDDIFHATSIPLVLHGGSGIPKAQIQTSLGMGISKINFDTELRLGFMSGLKDGAEQFADDPFNAMEHAKQVLKVVVHEKISYCHR